MFKKLLLFALSFSVFFSVGYAQPRELVDQRTETSKTYKISTTKFAKDLHTGAIHYKDNYKNGAEPWKEIDLTWSGNRIDKAPYILVRDGNIVTVTCKKTGKTSTIELTDIGNKKIKKTDITAAKKANIDTDVDYEIVPQSTKIRFQRTIKAASAAKDATFKFSGDLPLSYHAFDADGNAVEFEAKITNGVLTETVKASAKLKYPIKIDPTIDIEPAESADDVDVYYDGSAWQRALTRTYNRVGYNTATALKIGAGMRFKGANIPMGATHGTAYITSTAAENDSNTTVNSRFTGEKTGTPAVFSSLANYQARRGTVVGGANDNYITTAQVAHDNIAAWTQNTTYQSPELKTITQEIGDAYPITDIVIFWDDHEGRSTASNNTIRRAYSYDGDPAKAPVLHIEYTPKPFIPRIIIY